MVQAGRTEGGTIGPNDGDRRMAHKLNAKSIPMDSNEEDWFSVYDALQNISKRLDKLESDSGDYRSAIYELRGSHNILIRKLANDQT